MASGASVSKSVADQSWLCSIVLFGVLYIGVATNRCGPLGESRHPTSPAPPTPTLEETFLAVDTLVPTARELRSQARQSAQVIVESLSSTAATDRFTA